MNHERPILFSCSMVRAILAGKKVQTRRVMRPQPPEWTEAVGKSAFTPPATVGARGTHPVHGPCETFMVERYCAGDRLWVRETFQVNHIDHIRGRLPQSRPLDASGSPSEILYRANGEYAAQFEQVDSLDDAIWRPSIFMPRWASRITLEVTDVRMQRLQDISEEDARAEGCSIDVMPLAFVVPSSPRQVFERLWDSINGKRAPWVSNPWVWAISFRRSP